MAGFKTEWSLGLDRSEIEPFFGQELLCKEIKFKNKIQKSFRPFAHQYWKTLKRNILI